MIRLHIKYLLQCQFIYCFCCFFLFNYLQKTNVFSLSYHKQNILFFHFHFTAQIRLNCDLKSVTSQFSYQACPSRDNLYKHNICYNFKFFARCRPKKKRNNHYSMISLYPSQVTDIVFLFIYTQYRLYYIYYIIYSLCSFYVTAWQSNNADIIRFLNFLSWSKPKLSLYYYSY